MDRSWHQSRSVSLSLRPLIESVTLFEAGGMAGADIGLGWVDQAGKLNFEVSHVLPRAYSPHPCDCS